MFLPVYVNLFFFKLEFSFSLDKLEHRRLCINCLFQFALMSRIARSYEIYHFYDYSLQLANFTEFFR